MVYNMDIVTGYHFLRADMSSDNGPDRTPWTLGESRSVRGVVIPGAHGYHASFTVYDAIQFAPGPMLCVVELSGDITPHGIPHDKWAARTRKLLAVINVERQLREFAADCAEHIRPVTLTGSVRPRQILDAVRRFARREATQDEWAAIRTAVAVDCLVAFHESNVEDSAWFTVGSALIDAAWGAARTTAWSATGTASITAARDASIPAVWDAPLDTASNAAFDAEVVWQRHHADAVFLPPVAAIKARARA